MNMLVAAVAITALSAGQTAAGPFAGSWSATFAGRTFIRLDITPVNGTIAGAISLGNFEVDERGMVRRADAAKERLTPIFGATLKGSTLTFSIKEGDDTDQFELRLHGNAEAELHFLLNEADRKALAADGVTPPKPIRVTKGG